MEKNYNLINNMGIDFTEQEVIAMLDCDEYNDTIYFNDINRYNNIEYSEDDIITE